MDWQISSKYNTSHQNYGSPKSIIWVAWQERQCCRLHTETPETTRSKNPVAPRLGGNNWRWHPKTDFSAIHVYGGGVSAYSPVRLFATPWTVARQAPLSMEFSRQESWSGLPFPPSGDLPDPGTQPTSLWSLLHQQADSLPLEPPGKASQH